MKKKKREQHLHLRYVSSNQVSWVLFGTDFYIWIKLSLFVSKKGIHLIQKKKLYSWFVGSWAMGLDDKYLFIQNMKRGVDVCLCGSKCNNGDSTEPTHINSMYTLTRLNDVHESHNVVESDSGDNLLHHRG